MVSAGLVFLFLYVPLVVVVVFSFNDSKLNAEWVGFTLDWYRKLFNDADMLKAATNSLLIAVVASAIATVLAPWPASPCTAGARECCPSSFSRPWQCPRSCSACRCSSSSSRCSARESLSLLTVIVAHTTFCIGFVAIIVGRGLPAWTSRSSRRRATWALRRGRRSGW
jgi:spermidine/putrescine transport system permease protein